MSFYGYDPSKYIRDFSWIGDIGDAVGRAAQKMPELIELNRQINEDDKYQEKTFEAANRWLDTMAENRPELIDGLAISMGLVKAEDEDQSIERKTEELRKLITQPTLGTKELNSKEYTMSIANDFFAPILNGAQSKFGPEISMGELIEPLGTGQLASAVGGTKPVQNMQEEQRFGKRLEQQSQSQINTQKTIRGQKSEEELAAGQQAGQRIGGALPNNEIQTNIYNKVVQSGGTDQEAQDAVGMYNQMKSFSMKSNATDTANKIKTSGVKELVPLREAAQDNMQMEQRRKKPDKVFINRQNAIIRAVEKKLSKQDSDALGAKEIFESVAEERKQLERYSAKDAWGPDKKKQRKMVAEKFNIPEDQVELKKVNGKWMVDTETMFGSLGQGEGQAGPTGGIPLSANQGQQNTVRFSANGKIYNIPADKAAEFEKDNPNATRL